MKWCPGKRYYRLFGAITYTQLHGLSIISFLAFANILKKIAAIQNIFILCEVLDTNIPRWDRISFEPGYITTIILFQRICPGSRAIRDRTLVRFFRYSTISVITHFNHQFENDENNKSFPKSEGCVPVAFPLRRRSG